jgi:hypothetical protein
MKRKSLLRNILGFFEIFFGGAAAESFPRPFALFLYQIVVRAR